ncbi:MAG: ComEC/Rec2 family competence protein [Clostridiales Family XIII bacterium]|jgi:competence protein ComEC|nr:ComEC/Rec2 family competence protein [Clostridiales Family XIII bacterium]
MPVRRPLCFISFAYALGIGSAYIFSVDTRNFLIASAVCAAAVAISAFCCPGGDAPSSGRAAPRVPTFAGAANAVARRRVFPFVLLLVYTIGGAYCSHELQWVDPLEEYAVSPYHNVDAPVAEAEGEGSAMDDGGEPPGEAAPPSGQRAAPALRGRVMKVRVKEDDYRSLTVRSEGRDVLVNVSGVGLAPADIIGREIAFTGKVELPAGRKNPGTFDYALYLKTQDVRVIVKCEAKDVRVLQMKGSPVWGAYSLLCRLRYSFLESVRAEMPKDEYELFAGMMFGGSSEMDDESYDLFRRNGVAHILSVSGLHVAIVYAFLNMLFGRRRTLPVYAAIAAALVCYAAMSEFSPSVVRAVTMIGLHIASKILRVRYDLLTGTCAAALVMLVANPLDLLSVGFRLSFLAVLLLAFAAPLVGRYCGYRDRRTGMALSGKELQERQAGNYATQLPAKMVKVMLPVFVIQFGMAPLIAYEFSYVSLSGIVLNPPVVALAGWALPVGVCMLILHAVSLGASAAFSWAMGAAPPGGVGEGALRSFDAILGFGSGCEATMSGWIIGVTKAADAIPYGSFSVVSPPVQLVFAFYGVLFFMMSETRALLFARSRFRLVALTFACVALAATVTLASPVCRQDRSSLVFVDVGQGDCLHIRTPDGRNYLVDGGGSVDYNVGEKTLLPYLLKNGVGRLDGIFATHLHTDHWRGLCELSEHMDVGNVYIYEGNSARERDIFAGENAGGAMDAKDAERSPADGGETDSADGNRFSDGGETAMNVGLGNVRYIAQGDTATLGESVSLDILYPPRRAADEYARAAEDEAMGKGDENANSLIMKVDYDGVSVLMTGDAGEEAERALLGIYAGGGESAGDGSTGGGTGSGGAASALRSRILKVGHHGSKYSTTDDFLAAVAPDAAVIQVGRNTFGHPTAEVLDKLKSDDIMVFRNDLGGAVMFAIRDGKVTYAKDCRARFQNY